MSPKLVDSLLGNSSCDTALMGEDNWLLDLFFKQSVDGFFFMKIDEPIEWNDWVDKDAILDYVFDHQRIVRVSNTMAELYNLNKDDLIGLTHRDFYKHDIAYGKSLCRKLFDSGKLTINTSEYKFDGTPMIIKGDYTCVYDDYDRIIGHCGIRREITKELEDQKRLQQSEKNFKTFFNSIDNYLFILDEQTNIIKCNKAAIDRLGYSLDELVGKKMLSIHLADEKGDAERMAQEILQGKRDYCPVPLQTKTNELIPVETYVNWGEWNGKPAIFVVSKDVSKLKISEEKFAKAFHMNPAISGLSTVDSPIEYIDVNRTFYKKLGFTEEEVIGKNPETLLRMDRSFRSRLIEVLKDKGRFENVEGTIYTKSGEPLTVLLTAELVQLGGKMYNYTTAVDITSIKKTKEQLRKAKEKAEESDRLKSAFLANMSHEIRTPLNAVIGYSTLISESDLELDEIKEYVSIITNSGEHLLQLINDIIDISKIESGEISVFHEVVDINALLRDIYTVFCKHQNIANNDELDFFVDTPLDELVVTTDKTRLREIFENLLGNALKFTELGFIAFGYKIKDENLFFYVKDTGIGIPQDQQAEVFKRFTQVTGHSKKKYGGTGLGLSIVKACIDLLEGNILMESTPGKGTTFNFTVKNIAE
ncbi:PAS domain-containing sensor histidine kinase [Puteibacter caeruleilacunae]|nr:PAS domain-containing sensor histidine kinase [Puteibacter caeruleilacunae]